MNIDTILFTEIRDHPPLNNFNNVTVTSADRSVTGDFRTFLQLLWISDGILDRKGEKLIVLPYKYRNKKKIKATTFL